MAPESPATLIDLPRWRHRDRISPDGAAEFRFQRFNRYEPRPEIPDRLAVVREQARAQNHPDVEKWWLSILDEASAAREAWARDLHRAKVTESLHGLADAWPQWLAARQAADDAYTALERTPDGFWRAALLALATARRAARALAQQVDQYGRNIADCDREYRRVCDVPSWKQYASDAGINLPGWELHERDDYQASAWSDGTGNPTLDELNRVIVEQDERIRDAARLAGEPTPDGR
jgi:hypothetical protein